MIGTNVYSKSQMTSPTYYAATNSAFTYYGFPTSVTVSNNASYTANTVYAVGLTNLASAPPLQIAFDFTGTNFEVVVEAWMVTIEDGVTVTSVTNSPPISLNPNKKYFSVGFSSNILHHLMLNVSGGFVGINVTNASITPRPLPRQNLLIVEGDSYTEGYHQYFTTGYKWYDGWVWQLARLVPNTICIPSGIGGTGFSITGYGPTFGQRVVSDICTIYTNAIASGKYDKIFITASGSVNDQGQDTNALYAAATNLYTTIKTACPLANVFFVGNWRAAQGQTAPSANEINEDRKFAEAASSLGLPYFSPIQEVVLDGGLGGHGAIIPPGDYDLFFPANENSDNVHPGRYGYGVMAAWLNTKLVNTYGSLWSGSTNTVGPTKSVVSTNLSLNVANYGAVGDAVQLFVNTVSNSVVVTTTNQLSNADIGKVIEVFRVGTWHYGPNENGVWTNDCEDLITTVSNVVNGTNIYLAKPCLRSWANTFATYGTDNTPAFESAIAAASGHTNYTVNIPSGVFLMMPKFRTFPGPNGSVKDITYSSIYLGGGGIHFVGAGEANTTLLDKGAWTLMTNAFGGTGVARGVLVEVASLFANPFTNDYPLSFSDMTMDGGIEQGMTRVTGYPANNITGNGWGGGHNAYQLVGADNPSGRASDQTLSNICFAHWRAEMLISTDQYKNGKMLIKNCTFYDGNATALNIYPTLDVDGCTFSNMNQIAELYQYWTSGTTNFFRNNYVTNLTGNGFAWNGGTGTNSPYYFQNNTAYFNNAGSFLLTTPGDNIYIISNHITMQSGNSTFLDVGAAGYQGYYCNSNIVVSENNLTALGNSTVFVKIGGGPPNNVDTITICSNILSGFQYALYNYDYYTNVQFYANNMGVTGIYTPATASQFTLIRPNNLWSGIPFSDVAASTNLVSYGSWPKVKIARVSTVHAFRLEDSNASRIPVGAMVEFDNTANASAADVRVLPSQSSSNFVTVTNGTVSSFYWNGSTWTATRNAPVPPTNLHPLN